MILNCLKVAFIILLMGCSTHPTKKSEQIRSDLSRPYTIDIVAQPQVDKRTSFVNFCPTKAKDIESVDWSKLLELANGCIRKDNWEMLELIGKKLATDTSHSPWGPYYLSVVAEKQGNMPKALWMIDLAIKRSPNLGMLTYNRARLLWKMELFEESVASFEKSILLNVNVLEAHFFLGQIYLRDQDLTSAKNQFESSLKHDPQHFESLIEMAKIYNIKGDANNELIFLERAKNVKPDDTWIKQRLSILISKNLPREPASEDISLGKEEK